MAEELRTAQERLASKDLPGLLRYLRADGEALSLGEVATVMAQAAYLAGFDDLAHAAALASGADGSGGGDPQLLLDFGYECVEHKVGFVAVRPLARALQLAPDSATVLSELVMALAQEGQHRRALAVLEEHEPVLRATRRPRPHRHPGHQPGPRRRIPGRAPTRPTRAVAARRPPDAHHVRPRPRPLADPHVAASREADPRARRYRLVGAPSRGSRSRRRRIGPFEAADGQVGAVPGLRPPGMIMARL